MRFIYLDKVKAVDGFYKGLTGVVIEYIANTEQYVVRGHVFSAPSDIIDVVINEEHLESM